MYKATVTARTTKGDEFEHTGRHPSSRIIAVELALLDMIDHLGFGEGDTITVESVVEEE